MPRALLTVLVLASTVALGACGESALHRVAEQAGSPSTPPAKRGKGLAGRTPAEVLAATAAALAKVRSYHVRGTQTDDDGDSTISADVTADGRFRGRLEMNDEVVDVIAIGSDTYIKANRAYWAHIGGSRAPHLGLLTDRWVKAPGAATASLRDSLDKLRPDRLATCLAKASTAEGVVNEGRRRWHGDPVVVLRDPGHRPGTSPGELWVDGAGPPLPRRETQEGPRAPGGHIDKDCDDPDSTTRRADSRFSDYDKKITIEPPPNALDLDRLVPPRGPSGPLTPA